MVHGESARHTHSLIYICTRRYACSAIIAIKYVTCALRRHNYTWEMITAVTVARYRVMIDSEGIAR